MKSSKHIILCTILLIAAPLTLFGFDGNEVEDNSYCSMPEAYVLENPLEDGASRVMIMMLSQSRMDWSSFVEAMHIIATQSESQPATENRGGICRTDVIYGYDPVGLAYGDEQLLVELRFIEGCGDSYDQFIASLEKLNQERLICRLFGFAPTPIVSITTGGSTSAVSPL